MNKKPTSLKENLQGKIPQEFLTKINRSFEVVGNIAIVEIDEELVEYEKVIAQTLLEINKNITTVVKKAGFHGGVFRTQSTTVIAGEDTKIAIYKENGVTLKLHIDEVYFSTKLSTERENLANNLTHPKGNILVLFSGSGPYTFVLTRKNPDLSSITSVEINPQGHMYALQNLELNKSNLKQSQIYTELFEHCKTHNVKMYDKDILKCINLAIYQFYNCDAREFMSKLMPILEEVNSSNSKDSTPNNEFYTNNFFNAKLSFNELFEHLKGKDKHTQFEIHLDELSQEQKKSIKYLLLLFFDSFSYILYHNSKKYNISTLHQKNYLYQLLHNCTLIKDIVKYDEIYMPLPKDAEMFLDVAFTHSKSGSIIHMYDFVHINDFANSSEDKIKKCAKEKGIKVEILRTRKVGQYSPRKFRVCCDFRIL